MLKFLLLLNICNFSLSQLSVGGQRDDKNCLIGAGYTWCESSQNCIRQWEEPCEDNYLNCNDCLQKQRKGMNIACPTNCDIPCPLVMCDMYCENGFKQDHNGCDICICEEIETPIVIDPPPIAIDPIAPNIHSSDDICTIPYEECDNLYACPKITEVTHCSNDGLDGYTSYRLSIILKPNMNIKNIYALYGSEDSQQNSHMIIPPSKQVENLFGSNIGGVSDNMIRINPDSVYDSWLSIGITDGNINNDINSIGINYQGWNERNGMDINNGAIFLMNPDKTMNINQEIIMGQFTIRTGTTQRGKINIQGKYLTNNNNIADNSWKEENIEFILQQPNELINGIPNNCETWFDGCNTCRVSSGIIGACTRMMCFTENNPYCISYYSGH